jgi:ribosome biogenesis GTPase
MEGIVIKSTGSWYQVRMADSTIWNCRIKGKMRINDIKSTNPVAVGDHVEFEADKEVLTGIISSIRDRQNYIIRRSSNLSKQSQILAANIDQALLMVTVNYPSTTRTFIDRFLASAEAYRIPVTIVFNKIDLLDAAETEELKALQDIYESIGYQTLALSAINTESLEPVKTLLCDKVSMISGHSGVGKSTLINQIEPTLVLKTGEISNAHQTGKHTTTFAEMHPLSFGGYIIDTPGIRGFGLFEIEKTELHHFFREIFAVSENCQYSNCTHIHEPGCAVMEAVNTGEIAASRYESYFSIYNGSDEKYR